MLGIIGAMDVEVNAVKAKVTHSTVTTIAGVDFVCGEIEGVMVCVAQCSPGKVNTIKIETDREMSELLARTAINCGEKIHRGTIASGDKFIASAELKKQLADEFGAICGEMEGGAIGHVCSANGVKFAVLRSVSDGGDKNSLMDYPTFKNIAASISTNIILNFVKTQKTQLELF